MGHDSNPSLHDCSEAKLSYFSVLSFNLKKII